MKNSKEIQRCPICRSSEIYKRVWSKLWAEKSKLKSYGRDRAEMFKKKTKRYRCTRCKSEFDVPLIENI